MISTEDLLWAIKHATREVKVIVPGLRGVFGDVVTTETDVIKYVDGDQLAELIKSCCK